MAFASRTHNRPPEPIEEDSRAELRQRLERDHRDLLARCIDLEVALTQLPQEIDDENEGRIVEFFAKQLQPFFTRVRIAHDLEKANFLALGKVCDEFFTQDMQRRLADAAKPVNARVSAYREEQRRIAREIQAEEKRIAEEAFRLAQEQAERERLAAQDTAPLNRSEAREHLEAAKRAEVEAAEAARIVKAPLDPGHVRGEYGSVGYLRDTWQGEVENIDLVPKKYLTVDLKLVNADIATAVRECKRTNRQPPGIAIPGIKIVHSAKLIAKG